MSGTVRKGATVISNDPDKQTTSIALTGNIKAFIDVKPGFKIMFRGYYGDNIKKNLTITSFEDLPFEITEVKSDIDDKIQYKLTKSQEPEKYSLEIKTISGLKDSFRGKLMLKTNSKKKPELELNVFADMQSTLKVVPGYVYFGIIENNGKSVEEKSLQRIVHVNNVKGGDFGIEKIETNAKWIITEVIKDDSGKSFSVRISLKKDELPKGNFREKMTIITKSGGRLESGFVVIEGKVI